MVKFLKNEREVLKLLDVKTFNSILDSTYLEQQGEKKIKKLLKS